MHGHGAERSLPAAPILLNGKNMKQDDFGDRMKTYEATEAKRKLDPFRPICARIDGNRFSKFTANFKKPFDPRLSVAMRETCRYLVDQTDARIGYVQSDEISLIWLTRDEEGSLLFDARVQKLASITASKVAGFFMMSLLEFGCKIHFDQPPAFDSRVWQVPNEIEASNTILWPIHDARKNAVSAACRSIASPSEMHGLDQSAMIKLMASRGVNFATDFDRTDKFGTLFQRRNSLQRLDDDTWEKIPRGHRPNSRMVERSSVTELSALDFSQATNRPGVIFNTENFHPTETV